MRIALRIVYLSIFSIYSIVGFTQTPTPMGTGAPPIQYDITAPASPSTTPAPTPVLPPEPTQTAPVVNNAEKPIQIKFGVDPDYPPLEYLDTNGNIVGFDIEMGNAICKQINATCTFLKVPFDDLFKVLNAGQIDAILSGLTITNERLQLADFSTPYYFQTAIYVASKKITGEFSPTQLKGKTIGTLSGTVMDKFLNDIFGNSVTTKVYPDTPPLFADLKAGKLDYVLVDTPVAVNWLRQPGSEDYHMVGNFMTSIEYFGLGYGIAVKKGNKELLDRLNTGIKAVKENGDRYLLMKKYFSR